MSSVRTTLRTAIRTGVHFRQPYVEAVRSTCGLYVRLSIRISRTYGPHAPAMFAPVCGGIRIMGNIKGAINIRPTFRSFVARCGLVVHELRTYDTTYGRTYGRARTASADGAAVRTGGTAKKLCAQCFFAKRPLRTASPDGSVVRTANTEVPNNLLIYCRSSQITSRSRCMCVSQCM